MEALLPLVSELKTATAHALAAGWKRQLGQLNTAGFL
jgi:hypothetical protein